MQACFRPGIWHDPDATWQKYAKKAAVFGYKVHTVLCRQADLPVFILVTPASVHDSQVGWFVILMAAVIYGFRVSGGLCRFGLLRLAHVQSRP